jgi:hypothetical protein
VPGRVAGNAFTVSFVTLAGLSSVVQYRNSLSTNGNWTTLTNLPALSVTQTNVVIAPLTGSQRFFRVGLQ